MNSPADRDWLSFLAMSRPRVDWSLVGRILCLDPGQTTGWCIFNEGQLESAGQWDTPSPVYLADEIRKAFTDPEVMRTTHTIVYEEYRIRGNKAKEHVGSEVVTIQHIGVIKLVAEDLSVDLVKQSAGMAKAFATDTKLRRWGLYQPNLRHSNDAIRHGCYWHLFVAGRQQ